MRRLNFKCASRVSSEPLTARSYIRPTSASVSWFGLLTASPAQPILWLTDVSAAPIPAANWFIPE